MSGNLEEAIELTYQLFPGILERNKNLLFALKVRQFIEMINNANAMNNASIDEDGTDDQENADFSATNHNTASNPTNNNSNAKVLVDGTFILNNNNNIDRKNGFNYDNGFKNGDNLNVPSEEAMGEPCFYFQIERTKYFVTNCARFYLTE